MTTNNKQLRRLAYDIRRHVIETIITNGEGHVGGSLSSADLMAVLFGKYLSKVGSREIDRDRFLLSAGHKCLALYSALVATGVVERQQLKTYNQLNTNLPGHPDMKKIPAVDFSTGSLGHGLPIGCGMAMGGKLSGLDYKVYVLMGDGEQGEGSVWEAATFAAHQHLDNLVAIIDRNGLQINGTTQQVQNTAVLEERYQAFGRQVKTIDGHDINAIDQALNAVPFVVGYPSLIIANTIKGKGLSFAENNVKFHHWHADSDQVAQALEDLAEIERGLQND